MASFSSSSPKFASLLKQRQPAAEQFPGNKLKDYSGEPNRESSIHGVEKTDEIGRFCGMNLAHRN